MESTDYPALYQAADQTSIAGQRQYLRLVKADLAFVVAAATLGGVGALVSQDRQPIFAAIAAIVLAGSMIAKLVNRQRRDDRDWFDGRAVAETAKTATWRYMMRIEPFDQDATCDREFARELSAVRAARPGLAQDLRRLAADATQITDRMREVRRLRLPERRDFYVDRRLGDQAEWYRGKAQLNRVLGERWFLGALAAQVAALAVAIVRIAVPTAGLNLVGLFAVLAAAATAWAQLGRHDELAKSYALAYQELLTIKDLARTAATQAELADAVRDGEGASSREHTMWIAKRGDPLPVSMLPSSS